MIGTKMIASEVMITVNQVAFSVKNKREVCVKIRQEMGQII
ncbi:MAG: hypothetical protein ABIV51_14005 [Saprospiraceae bacterium]